MCFTECGDSDWSASLIEQEWKIAHKVIKCHECRADIACNEEYLHIFMQENEYCWKCDPDSDEFIEDEDNPADPATCEHDFGEEYTYKRCRGCDNFLNVIEKIEEEEGCPSYTRRPALESLLDTLLDIGPECDRYVTAALEKHPELKDNRIIKRLLEDKAEREEESGEE